MEIVVVFWHDIQAAHEGTVVSKKLHQISRALLSTSFSRILLTTESTTDVATRQMSRMFLELGTKRETYCLGYGEAAILESNGSSR